MRVAPAFSRRLHRQARQRCRDNSEQKFPGIVLPRNAQLIFTTQDTNLLDTGLLRRDQVWFTEKDDQGKSHLYPLTDYKPRKNENLERGYLQGRYGAVPFLGSLAG